MPSSHTPPSHTGQAYLKWLRAARATLDVGVAAFIDRNTDFLTDQLAAPYLLPLLQEASIADLIATQYDRYVRVCERMWECVGGGVMGVWRGG